MNTATERSDFRHSELKALDTITDRRAYAEQRRYNREESPKIERAVRRLWKEQAKLITRETARVALEQADVPQDWEGPWDRMTREFVRDDVVPQWMKAIAVAGHKIAAKINRLQRKQFDFDSTLTSVKAWADSEAGRLIVDLTAAQTGSIQALLQHQTAFQVTSPAVLAQRLKPVVGLTVREANAVAKFAATLMEEGVAAGTVNELVAKYARFLHKNRAMRIARTELNNAYNFGQLDAMRQAVDQGWVPGTPEKEWMAGGADPCEICQENEGAGPIALDAAFPSGDEHPTAHPNCECAVGYKVRR